MWALLPSWSNDTSKAAPHNIITLGVRISAYAFWGKINIQIIAERMWDNLTLFLNKLINNSRNDGAPKCVLSLGIWEEGVRWLIRNISTRGHLSTIYNKSRSTTMIRPRTRFFLWPRSRWTIHDSTALCFPVLVSSGTSALPNHCLYHHRISVDIIKQPLPYNLGSQVWSEDQRPGVTWGFRLPPRAHRLEFEFNEIPQWFICTLQFGSTALLHPPLGSFFIKGAFWSPKFSFFCLKLRSYIWSSNCFFFLSILRDGFSRPTADRCCFATWRCTFQGCRYSKAEEKGNHLRSVQFLCPLNST